MPTTQPPFDPAAFKAWREDPKNAALLARIEAVLHEPSTTLPVLSPVPPEWEDLPVVTLISADTHEEVITFPYTDVHAATGVLAHALLTARPDSHGFVPRTPAAVIAADVALQVFHGE